MKKTNNKHLMPLFLLGLTLAFSACTLQVPRPFAPDSEPSDAAADTAVTQTPPLSAPQAQAPVTAETRISMTAPDKPGDGQLDEHIAAIWDGHFRIIYPYPMSAVLQVADETLDLPAAGASAEAAAAMPGTEQELTLEDGAASHDLWDRIRDGFGITAAPKGRIEAERNWYANHPSYLQRTIERARPYLHLIVEALDERHMPMEIALLPIVESAYQPFAYSHGRAAGIWQFIPGTARHYGLKQNWWYDGRRDILESTRAALDYLQYLHKTFDGDWLLALAAYNSGSGTVRNAIRKNRRHGKPTDFWSLHLPRETQAYVPKLLAISEIIAEPEKFQLSLAPISDEPYLVPVTTGSQIDLALAAELAGLSLDEIYRFNPGFNHWATDPDGPHRLLLPASVAEPFSRKLGEVPAGKRIKWVRHLIREGETLGHIAQRYGTTVAVLKQVNGIGSHLIHAGKSMIIPVATRDLRAYRLSEEQRLRAIQSRPKKGIRIVHTVRQGDTLWDLSHKYHVGTRQLAKWNGMAPRDYLRPGQKLVIWKKARNRGARSRTASLTPGLNGITQRIHYTVRKGDSLARISQKFKVTVSELRMWNALPKGKYLQPGQKLTLYVDVTRQTGS